MPQFLRHLASISLGICIIASAAAAYPTALNILPTADMLPPGKMRCELEWDVAVQPAAPPTGSIYLQCGLLDWLEGGLDAEHLTENPRWRFNCKVRILKETKMQPALAVGAMNIQGFDAPSEVYIVASRQRGRLRLHSGLWLQEGTGQAMGGFEYDWNERTGLLGDALAGQEGYWTLGVYQALGNDMYACLYGAWGHAEKAERFVGLNLCLEFNW